MQWEHRHACIYLVRHAEAEGNLYRIAHGHYNGLITARGYKQIAVLQQRLLLQQQRRQQQQREQQRGPG